MTDRTSARFPAPALTDPPTARRSGGTLPPTSPLALPAGKSRRRRSGRHVAITVALAAGLPILAAAVPQDARSGDQPALAVPAATPAPSPAAKQLAERALSDLQAALDGGDWQPFTECLAQEVTLRVAAGPWQGTHTGAQAARDYFTHLASPAGGGLRIEAVETLIAQDDRVFAELRTRLTAIPASSAEAPAASYLALAFRLCGDRVCELREYLGTYDPVEK
jgi:ketosteroid isomerase-like protein